MDSCWRRTLVWLVLSVQSLVARGNVEADSRDDPQVSAVYSISTGMQLVQSVSMGQIAMLLDIPASRLKIPAKSLLDGGLMPDSPLRQALHTACSVRSRVEQLAGVWREMPGDLELNVMLELMTQVQTDSYRWLAVESETDLSVLSDGTLASLCLQWEALLISEEADLSLQQFIAESGLTTQHSHRKQITFVTVSEIIMQYFSP